MHLLNECCLLSPGRPRFFGFLNYCQENFSVPLIDLDEFIFNPTKELVEEIYLFFSVADILL